MFLVTIHNILQCFFLPPMNGVMIILLGVWFSHKLKPKLSMSLIITGCVFLYIQSIPPIIYLLSKVVDLPPITSLELQEAQAIIILGGGTLNDVKEYGNTNSVPNKSTLIRLEYAAFIAQKYPNKFIFVSGGLGSSKYSSEAAVMKATLINLFHVTNPIIIENKSRNTKENAKFITKMLIPLQIKKVVIVTQASQAKRALKLFKNQGIEATAASTDYLENNYRRKSLTVNNLIPNASNMAYCSQLLHEIYGYILNIRPKTRKS